MNRTPPLQQRAAPPRRSVRSLAPSPFVALAFALSFCACSDGPEPEVEEQTASGGVSGGGNMAGGSLSGEASSGGASSGEAEGGGRSSSVGGSPSSENSSGGNAVGGNAMPGSGGDAQGTTGGASDGGSLFGPGGTPGVGGSTMQSGGNANEGSGGANADAPNALFVAPDGTVGAAGTIDAPTTLGDALDRVQAGETIYIRGGTYHFDNTFQLERNGTAGSVITLSAYPNDAERPSFDFSSMPENSSNRGLILSGDYWYIYGIDLFGAGDNCMFVAGSHNIIEFSTFSECKDTGLQLGNGAADNLVQNCDSYFNADSSLENADGFAAKLDVGSGNKFVGCRAWNNLDDGWDGYLRPADHVLTTYENCWAIDNGKLKNGSVGAGDGNGFKTGGSDDKNLSHDAIYAGCIAAGNVHDGFDHNSNRGNVTIVNSAAHDNGSNINFSSSNIAASLVIKNTISLGSLGSLSASSTDITHNSWQNGLSAGNTDFVSVDIELLKAQRKSDGSLPDVDYLKLVPGSSLRNVGTDVGLPYKGSAPDLGPFESDG